MTVYIVIETIPYEGGNILGVFSTQELARARMDSYKQDGYYSYDIDTVELDAAVEISV